MKEIPFDERRVLIIPGNNEETLEFCIQHWLETARNAIHHHDFFSVALSGGSTPKAIYQGIVKSEGALAIDWEKVYFFWSDERSVPPSDRESNYHMAIEEAGLKQLPVPKQNIFRMVAETDLEENAKQYENLILEKLGGHAFDLIMLGMGEDGHTASLFPHTAGLHVQNRLVIANQIPQKSTWRMSLTFECINAAEEICIYALGGSKARTLLKVFSSPFNPDEYPSQQVGTPSHKAKWILDEPASELLHEYVQDIH